MIEKGAPIAEPKGRLGVLLVGMGAVAIGLDRVTRNRDLTWRFAKGRARDLAKLLGVEVTVRGAEHLASGGPFVLTPNHQSHLDILALLGFLPGRTRFAAKREMWRHPVVGGVLDTLDMVPIDRENPEVAIAALAKADGAAGSLVVFPEGTRSRDGSIGRLKKGGFHLALGTGAPIVPVAIKGTIDILPRGAKTMKTGCTVEVTIVDPIDVASRDIDGLMTEVRDFLVKNVENGQNSMSNDG